MLAACTILCKVVSPTSVGVGTKSTVAYELAESLFVACFA